jgi:hypothetical protein
VGRTKLGDVTRWLRYTLTFEWFPTLGLPDLLVDLTNRELAR